MKSASDSRAFVFLGYVEELDGADHGLVVPLLSPDAAAVLKVAAGISQVLRRVPEAVVMSIMQGIHTVGPHQAPPGWPVGHTAAGTPSQVQ